MLIITFGSLTNYGGSKRGESERERGRIEGRGAERREREEDKKWVEREMRWRKAFMPVKTELWCDHSL